ncbi:MAG TPA: GAF domain-containing protein [Terriglobales bacterium]|nr:GAF domain-containing protein [Terriglobales bacterium]
MSTTDHQTVQNEIAALATTEQSLEAFMQRICELLNQHFLKYNWVGFYMVDPNDPNTLVLGPFIGSITPHVRIPLNEGICGAAVSTGQTLVVDDVNSDPRYLACSIETKSELVVPISVNGKIVGEIDIDSHFPAAFTPEDRSLVEHCAALVGSYMESHPS